MIDEKRRAEDLRYQQSLRYAKANPTWSGNRPETLGEAQAWDEVKSRYTKDGLCHGCAAQAAYGHQLGFTLIRPPCAQCAPVVASFPQPSSNPSWRRWKQGRQRPKGQLEIHRHGAAPSPGGSGHSEGTPAAPAVIG